MIRLFHEIIKRAGWQAFILLLWSGTGLYAQDSLSRQQEDKIRAVLEKVQQTYQHAAYLGFRLRYVYANEGAKADAVDSLNGEVEMDKNRCRFVIAGTETLMTPKYIVQVMPEEKSIYVSGARPRFSDNPVTIADSILSSLKVLRGEFRQEEGMDIITLHFPAGQTYSGMRLKVDDRTGYFSEIRYSVHTQGLVSADQIDQPGHPAVYQPEGHVDIYFSHYEQGKFGDGLFDEGNYFTKTAGRFMPSVRFSTYHIYPASSNL